MSRAPTSWNTTDPDADEEDDDITRIFQPETLTAWQVRHRDGSTEVLNSLEIEARLRSGSLAASLHVAEHGTTDWRLLSEVPGFARALLQGSTATLPDQQVPLAAPSANSLTPPSAAVWPNAAGTNPSSPAERFFPGSGVMATTVPGFPTALAPAPQPPTPPSSRPRATPPPLPSSLAPMAPLEAAAPPPPSVPPTWGSAASSFPMRAVQPSPPPLSPPPSPASRPNSGTPPPPLPPSRQAGTVVPAAVQDFVAPSASLPPQDVPAWGEVRAATWPQTSTPAPSPSAQGPTRSAMLHNGSAPARSVADDAVHAKPGIPSLDDESLDDDVAEAPSHTDAAASLRHATTQIIARPPSGAGAAGATAPPGPGSERPASVVIHGKSSATSDVISPGHRTSLSMPLPHQPSTAAAPTVSSFSASAGAASVRVSDPGAVTPSAHASNAPVPASSVAPVFAVADPDDVFTPARSSTIQRLRLAGGALVLLLLVFVGVQLSLLRSDLGEAAERDEKLHEEREALAKKAAMERDTMQAKLAEMGDKAALPSKAVMADEAPPAPDEAMASKEAVAEEASEPDDAASEEATPSTRRKRSAARSTRSSLRTTTSALRPSSAPDVDDDPPPAPKAADAKVKTSAKESAKEKEPAKAAESSPPSSSKSLNSGTSTGGTSTFNVAKAGAALNGAARAASSCGKSGQAKVRVLFTNNGTVQRVNIDASGLSSSVSNCVVSRFQGLKIPAYSGAQAAVSKTVTLR